MFASWTSIGNHQITEIFARTKIDFDNIRAEEIDKSDEIDFCFSIGVIHHIPNADIAVKNIFNALKKDGEFVLWVYGYEGNEIYLAIFNNLRRISRVLPDSMLRCLCSMLNLFCSLYIILAKVFPLPLPPVTIVYLFLVVYKALYFLFIRSINPMNW